MALYDAFISYSHAKDKPIAAALHSAVQKLGKPWYRRRALRVFRDDTSLSATPSLWPSIERALSESRYLILLASPEAAKSPWVNKELTYWLDHKSADTLLLALTDGKLAWDNALNDFARREGVPLPPVLTGRFATEPKWVDLTAYRDGADKRDAKFTELAADFAAAIRGMPKEDLLSQEVRQQRRALSLAWSAAVGLLALAVVAVWQWTRAIEQTNAANAQRALAESERNRADEQRQRAESAQAQAESERDKAQQALLVAAARQSLLLTSDHRPEQAWTTLTEALDVTEGEKPSKLPALLYEAGLTSLIEDRHGPKFIFKLGERSLKAAENNDASLRLSPSVIAAFDVEGDRVAVAKYFDLRIWSTANGAEISHFELTHQIDGVSFNQRGDVLIVDGRDDKKNLLTLVDFSSNAKRTFELKNCFGLINCIGPAPSANTKPANIRKFENLAGLIRSDAAPSTLIVPPSKPHLMVERYYTFLNEPEREGEPSVIAIYDIVTNTTMRFPFKGKAYEQLSVAKDQPLLVVYSSFGPKLDVFRLDINASNPTRSSLRFVKQHIARDSVAIKDVALSDDGRLLYYSNWGGGASSGGRGALIAAVLDVETGREIWSMAFDGDTRFGPGQQFIARTSEQLSGGVRTSFADGRTQQERLAVDGVPVEFDPTSRMALMEERSQREPETEAETLALRGAPTKLVLVELSHIANFAHEPRWPRALQDTCELAGRRFKTLSDRAARPWNAFDWHLTTTNAIKGEALASIEGRRELLRFRWDTKSKDTIEVVRDETLVARGSLQEIAKLYPNFALLIKPGIDVQVAEFGSPDGRWLVFLHQFISQEPSPIHWRIFRLDGNERQMFKSGTTRDSLFNTIGAFFLARAPVVVIHDDACSLTLINLTDGSSAGQIRPPFSHEVRVKQIADDMLAVYSYDVYSEAKSVQLLSYPDLYEGPWFILWDDQGMKALDEAAKNGKRPSQSDPPRLPGYRQTKPLVANMGEMEIVDEGRTLLVRPEDGPPTALMVPPWGQRLRDLLGSKERFSPSPN